MYAVIRTGGKQYRVEPGQRLEVERVAGAEGDEVELAPVLLVDGDQVLATPDQLAGVIVRGRVVGETRGPKIDGFTYKPKSNQRRRWGHRQHLSVIEITDVGPAGAKPKSRTRARKSADTPATATVERPERDQAVAAPTEAHQDEPDLEEPNLEEPNLEEKD
jgi:large subunit ribosomal protein L21